SSGGCRKRGGRHGGGSPINASGDRRQDRHRAGRGDEGRVRQNRATRLFQPRSCLVRFLCAGAKSANCRRGIGRARRARRRRCSAVGQKSNREIHRASEPAGGYTAGPRRRRKPCKLIGGLFLTLIGPCSCFRSPLSSSASF